uniref:FTH domain-containing protein n=1 Tax=Caenorhabditis tropicalis TaxID=1561998 RepID=A0A1I7UV30_9PELO
MNRCEYSNEYLKIYTQYEYLKRNSVEEAVKNINGLIKRQEKEEPRVLRALKASNGIPRTDKKKLQYSDNSAENVDPMGVTIVRCISDPDSETADIEASKEIEGGDLMHKLKVVRQIYRTMAKAETMEILIEAINNRRQLTSEDILKLLSIRHSTITFGVLSILESICLPIDKLHITIGFQKIVFRINDTTLIEYWRGKGTSWVRYGDTVMVNNGMKYQQSAAYAFSYLVQHPKAIIQELKFDIEKYRFGHPKQYPFVNFLSKINKLMESKEVNVKELSMEYFNQKDDLPYAPSMFQLVFEFSKGMETIKMKRWDDRNVDNPSKIEKHLWEIWEEEKWRNVKKLELDDSVVAKDFDIFYDLNNQQFESMVKNFMRTPPYSIFIYPDESFDWHRAKEFVDQQCEQKLDENRFFFAGGLVVRFEMQMISMTRRY